MSDTGRKPLVDQAQEKLTPDSQKSTADKAKEGITSTADDVAGMVQPGDSKSTTQKLSDETSSTASSLGKQTSEATGTAQEEGKTYLAQAQDLAASALNSASKVASDLASSISGEKK